MQVSAIIYPVATVITTATSLLLSTYQMTMSNVDYTFGVTTGQGLGTTPMLKISNIPSIVTVPAAPTCSVTISSATVTASACLFDNVTRVIEINFTSTSLVASGSPITVVIGGVTNPGVPNSHTIGL